MSSPETDRTPLAGIGVVVTRPAGQSGELCRLLRSLGATAVALPVTRIEARTAPWTEAERESVRTARVVVLSSANGAREFARQLAEHDCAPGIDVIYAAVGELTAREAASAGLPVGVTGTTGTGAGLVDDLAALVDLTGAHVVLARALQGRPELPAALAARGARVSELPLYATVPHHPDERPIAAARECDIWTFTSPSGVDGVLAIIERGDLAASKIVSIGPTTSAHLRTLGLRVDAEADNRSDAGLVEAVRSVASAGRATDRRPG